MLWLIFSLFLTAAASCGPLNPLFAGGPYKGKVVDAETKGPLVGAVVLAVWYRSAPTLVGTPKDFLDAEEVLTDSQGEFVVGKSPPASWIPGTWVTDPDITIFYPGYGYFPYFHVSPPYPPTGYKGLLEVMEREVVVIELPRLKTEEERRKACTFFIVRGRVPEEKMPNLVRLLRQGGDPCSNTVK